MTSQASPLQKRLKIALIQISTSNDKSANLKVARAKICEAASEGAKLIVLPECFNSPYGCNHFADYAEELKISQCVSSLQLSPKNSPDECPSYKMLSEAAHESKVWLVGGSIPEIESTAIGPKYYNTLLLFSPSGELVAYHRKLHLFDIDIPGSITFRESDVLSSGDKVTVASIPEYGNIMLGICYDIRFPEPAILAARRHNCFALIYPGAFNLITGPMHWSLLCRSRALDNQLYVAVCSPARNMEAEYHAFGHSMIADPMARVIAEADHNESIIYAEMVPDEIDQARAGIPTTRQRRFDVYPNICDH